LDVSYEDLKQRYAERTQRTPRRSTVNYGRMAWEALCSPFGREAHVATRREQAQLDAKLRKLFG